MSPDHDKTHPAFRLGASMSCTKFRPGEPIYVAVVLENVSTLEAMYGVQSKDFDYRVECFNARGNRMPPTLYGEHLARNQGQVRCTGSTLKPGQYLTNTILISRVVDLSLIGRYQLSVSREVFPRSARSEPILTSNVCMFEIIE